MRLWAVSDAGAPELRGLREAWLQAYEADMAASGDALTRPPRAGTQAGASAKRTQLRPALLAHTAPYRRPG